MAVITCWLLLQILMRSSQQVGGGNDEVVPFTSPEDIMKNLPKVMSNMFGKSVGGGDSPTFKITMKEYEDMAIKVGDKVRIEIKKADNSGV
jgi:hypothetical protein